MSFVVWALLCAIALSGCGQSQDAVIDPVCGSVPASVPMRGVRLQRIDGRPPLFVSAPTRRFAIGGHARDTLTGFREIRLFERVLDSPSDPARHVETVVGGHRLGDESVVLFAPRVRRPGDAEWAELGWVEVVSRREDAETLYDVPFELTDLAVDGQDLEIGLSAFVSTNRSHHVMESPASLLPEGSVLFASLGAIPAGREQGLVAWRVLVCEGGTCHCIHAEVMDAAKAGRAGWQERRIPLDDWAGRSISIRFETEALGGAQNAADAGLWAEPEIYQRVQSDVSPPTNVLMISLDTLGADHLGLYGYPRNTSPYIDGVLAARGTTFMETAAPATSTGPSHMTLFTSLPPSVHGFVSNLGGRPLPEPVPTLASTLRDAGYVTGAITENGAITRSVGFGRGFDYYQENRSVQRVRPEGHIEATFDAGRRFIDRVRGLPWFLFLHTYQVHHAYTPPPGYDTLFEGDGLDTARVIKLFSRGRHQYHPVRYDREIRFADDQLRELLSGLDADGLLDNTLVIVLSDHGEAFFEHTYLGHGADLHRETVRIPLIFMGPHIPSGRRIAEGVGLADVMPTVLELLHVPAPIGLLGQSLVPSMTGNAKDEASRLRPIFSEAWQTLGVTQHGGVKIDQPTLAVRYGDYKLIRYRSGTIHRYAFFDLSSDPLEQNDLMVDDRALLGEVARRFDTLAGMIDDYEDEAARLAAALGVVPDASPQDVIDPERLEKLRALGYVE